MPEQTNAERAAEAARKKLIEEAAKKSIVLGTTPMGTK